MKKEGEISAEPVRSQFGYHIIRLDAYAEGQALPFEAVKRRLSEAAEKAAWTTAQRYFAGTAGS